MAINLPDIRDAVVDYLATVTTDVSKPVADVPDAISPDEGFSFEVTVTNGVVQLIDVVYHVRIHDDNDQDASKEAKLIVPNSPPARASLDASDPLLNEGDEVQELFLYRKDSTLEPLEAETVELTGKALKLGSPTISAHIHAELDPEWLYAPFSTSKNTERQFKIK